MKDKIAQRERTEALVGGARTFNEFVKEKAGKYNLTPACVRSLPEVKEEWLRMKQQITAEKKAQKLAKSAETKAEKKALREAKKAEKKAEKSVKKAEKSVDKEIRAEKTAIKKVAKKADANAENIKMLLVEKAHQDKPVEEPKIKGRPKKYATAEEARRAKIEQTKAINKAKKASLPPKEPKPPKAEKEPRKRKYVSKFDAQLKKALKEQAPPPPPKEVPVKRAYKKQVAPVVDEAERRQRNYDRNMMMTEDVDAPEKYHPLVQKAEAKLYQAKSLKDLDEVLRIIKQVMDTGLYDKLDKANQKSIDRTIDIYSKKRQWHIEHDKKAMSNIDMMKQASVRQKLKKLEETKVPPLPAVSAQQKALLSDFGTAYEQIRQARDRKGMKGEDMTREEKTARRRVAVQKEGRSKVKAMVEKQQRVQAEPELLSLRPPTVDEDRKQYLFQPKSTRRQLSSPSHRRIPPSQRDAFDRQRRRKIRKDIQYELVIRFRVPPATPAPKGTTLDDILQLNIDKVAEESYTPNDRLYPLAKWAYSQVAPELYTLDKLNKRKVGGGFNPELKTAFDNYGKIQDHLAGHLNDLKEAIDPKDLQDFIHFTKEKARLKERLFGGRMIGGMEQNIPDLVDTVINQSSMAELFQMAQQIDNGEWGEVPQILNRINSRLEYLARQAMTAQNAPVQTTRKTIGKGYSFDSDSESDMEGGGDFFGNIKRAFTSTWNQPVQSEAERKALDATLNVLQPAVIQPLTIVAPPVGKIAEAQRKLMKSKYGV